MYATYNGLQVIFFLIIFSISLRFAFTFLVLIVKRLMLYLM